jgi:hypothetical protein
MLITLDKNFPEWIIPVDSVVMRVMSEVQRTTGYKSYLPGLVSTQEPFAH